MLFVWTGMLTAPGSPFPSGSARLAVAGGTRSTRRTTNTFRLVNAVPDLDTAVSAERNEFKIIRLQEPCDFEGISRPMGREPGRWLKSCLGGGG